MAKMFIGKGIDNYVQSLESLLNNSQGMIGQAVYEGAKIVADAVMDNINAIPVGRYGIRGYQKDGLIEGFGISKSQNSNGFINVKIGFEGYNVGPITDQPNAMIARSLEKGTSWMKPIPFVTRAVNATKAAAEKAMADKLDELHRQKFGD